MNRCDNAANARMIVFDRESGRLTGAGQLEAMAIRALQAGSVLTRPFGHRGYGLGCRAVSVVATCDRDIAVKLNSDAVFAMPFADAYWSRILNRRYDYEEDIAALLKSAARFNYTLIDCGANFGYWSVLASSAPFGRQTALAIEASPTNAAWLDINARLNGNRFRCLNAAIGGKSGGFAAITGRKHEAFAAVPIGHLQRDAVRIVSLDGLVDEGMINSLRPIMIKLDVEGLEIEAIEGAGRLLATDSIVICEDHGSDRTHSVSRHLLTKTALKVFVFDPAACGYVPVVTTTILDRIKRYGWVGYNVCATASPFWEDRILSATWIYR